MAHSSHQTGKRSKAICKLRGTITLVAIAVMGIVLAAAGCGAGPRISSTSAKPSVKATRVAVTLNQLRIISRSAGHPIYWAGPATGTYELTRISDGRTYIRYLPPGVHVGDSGGSYLTIGTYVRSPPPYGSVRNAALAQRAKIHTLTGGGLVVAYSARPQSVYMVFPGALFEIEVYDPSAATAFRLATTGKVVPVS